MYISIHSQLVHTLRNMHSQKGAHVHTCTHTLTYTHGGREGGREREGLCIDLDGVNFSSGPFLQHAADERIRLEELRKKVKKKIKIVV